MRATTIAVATLAALSLAAASPAQDWTEPKSGVAFETARDDMTLLGAGLRVKKILFVKAKVYAVGLYVSDAALQGPLAAYKGKTSSPEFYKALVTGDFDKQLVLKFTRNLEEDRIRGAMREALEGADKATLDQFVSYFPEIKDGQECVLRWAKGGSLESTMAGTEKPPIANRAFTERLFGLYVGDQPLQDDIKEDLAARAGEVLK